LGDMGALPRCIRFTGGKGEDSVEWVRKFQKKKEKKKKKKKKKRGRFQPLEIETSSPKFARGKEQQGGWAYQTKKGRRDKNVLAEGGNWGHP